jgi:VIT1/CCC1 family predicted Fe2+/Mn2+ transporter
MDDNDIVTAILGIGFLPFICSLVAISAYVQVSSMPLILVVSLILSMMFLAIVWAYHPRIKHWNKAYLEFEKTYRYDPKGADE